MNVSEIIEVIQHADLTDEDFKSGDIWIDCPLDEAGDTYRINVYFEQTSWLCTLYKDVYDEDTGYWETDTTTEIQSFTLGKDQMWDDNLPVEKYKFDTSEYVMLDYVKEDD